jgi:hypothetical protein
MTADTVHATAQTRKSRDTPKDPNRPLLPPQRLKPDRKLVATLLAERLNELPPDSLRRRAILRMLGHGEAS